MNVPQGVTQAGPEESVNSAAGFEAAMAAKGVPREERDGEAVDTDIASGLTFGELPTLPPVEDEQPAPEVDDEPHPDPLEEYIATRHGGDRDAALAALHQEATNQRSVIGRQGQELGNVRKLEAEIAELRGAVSAFTQIATAPPGPVTAEDAAEQAMDMVGRMGYAEAATEAANIAHQTGDDRIYSQVIDAWNLEEPYQALTHVADFRAWQRDEQAGRATQPDEWVAEQKTIKAIEAPLEKLSANLGEERWAIVAPRMEKALEALPQAVAEMVVNPDADVAYQGLEIVSERAYLLGLAEERQKAERAKVKMSGARVATSSLRPPVVPSSGEITPDDIAKAKVAFKQEMMATETTNVREGLTFGKAAPQIS